MKHTLDQVAHEPAGHHSYSQGVTLTKGQRWRTGKNALANVCRGGATAVVALALPHFLTRSLGGERFAAWSLMLQMAAIAAYFDFGLQTILGRFVAQAAERGDDEALGKLANTSMMLLAMASLLPLAACVLFIPFLPLLFHSSSIVVLHEIQKGVAILVIGTALSLPLSACTGLLVGLHRNEIPAAAIGTSRLLGALTVILFARHHGSLMVLAFCFTSWNLVGGLAQLLWVRRLLPSLKLAVRFYDGQLARKLIHHSLVLTVLSFCMIIISNVDLTIVGHFNFIAVGPYSVATTLTTFLYGLNATVCAAFYAPIAVMEQRGDQAGIRTSLERLTFFTSLINMAVIVGNYLLGKALLTVWVGPAYTPQTFPILQVLLVANAIRLVASPFAAGVIATARHKALISGGVIEAAVNLPLSILGAIFIGPIGVAYGTLVGAVVGVVWILSVTSRVSVLDLMTPGSIVSNGLLKPLMAFIPIVLFCLWQGLSRPLSMSLCYLSSAATLLTLWGTVAFERERSPGLLSR
jgi:O-antigen/teichoic acid export membrane protein